MVIETNNPYKKGGPFQRHPFKKDGEMGGEEIPVLPEIKTKEKKPENSK